MFTRLITLSFAIACALSLSAGADERQAEFNSYQYQVELNTLANLHVALTPAKFAAQSERFSLPILPPAYRPETVKEMAEAELNLAVEEKFPRERYQEIIDEAQEMFRLYEEGEHVTITAHKVGQEPQEFSGILHRKTATHVRVGDYQHAMRDIVPQDQARFLRELQDQYINRYIRVNRQLFERDRQQFEREQRNIIFSTTFQQNGYMAERGRWFPALDLFLNKYNEYRQELYNQIRAREEAAVLQANGWYFDDTNSRWTHAKYEQESTGAPVATPTVSTTTTTMEQARPVLADIVSNLYGGGDTNGGGSGTDLFGTPAPAPEAPAPEEETGPQGDVSDLYDED